MTLSAATFLQLAAACGPSVHVETLASVAQAESGLDPLAIHDNLSGRTYRPLSMAQAVRLATDLIHVRRHSVDLGLMQVNSANLKALRLSIADSFAPCKNIAAGAQVLVGGYQSPGSTGDTQPALLRALSRYNTGRPDRGFANGYVRRVQLAARQIVPAIRLATPNGPQGEGADAPPVEAATPLPPPPSWDVYGRARALRDKPSGLNPATDQTSSPPDVPAKTAGAEVAPPVRLQTITSATADDR